MAYTSAPAGAAETQSSATTAAPASTAAYDDSSALPPAEDSADEADYGIEPEATATEAPPPLPEYQQPPCPGDGYIWTPGYWYYGSSGYYWVPGAWVQAPYQEALWTPGYWAYANNRYVFFHGYWGPHIGFYGGINYGFGYAGLGYQGGYWQGGHFLYNRAANNINERVVHNVYNRTIVHTTVVNRVSYNGGGGGIRVRPRPAELVALREPHAQPMRTQMTIRHDASQNRAQFASANHGRPAQFIAQRPVAADHNVKPVRNTRLHNLPPLERPGVAAHPAPAAAMRPEQNRAVPNRAVPNRAVPNHTVPNRGQPNRAEPVHPEPNHAQPGHPKPNRAVPNRAVPNRAAPQHTEPGRTAPSHPAPAHPQPQHRSAPPSHEQPHAEHHAAPAQHQERDHAPAEHKDDNPHS
ncbi:MAG TPA: hypothetical protein VHX20_10730 [Terracidiphilus sp.]|nr:hypothetical protein [Terracidiphilus sp.]